MAALVVLAGVAPLRAEPATFTTRVAPVLEANCVVCHGENKHKAGLRLDSLAALLRGGNDGAVIKPGDLKGSELFHRITLAPSDEDFMPSEGKPPLAPADIAILEKWISAGAPEMAEFDAPALVAAVIVPPAAPDYRSRLAEVTELARVLGVRLVPRSRVPTDGLVLRTASAPIRCDDALLAKLAPTADLIVEAELAGTKITDAGATTLAHFANLHRLDLARTAITSDGLTALGPLLHLEFLNLHDTAVTDAGLPALRALKNLRYVVLWHTHVTPSAVHEASVPFFVEIGDSIPLPATSAPDSPVPSQSNSASLK
jgi:hypothetical protein